MPIFRPFFSANQNHRASLARHTQMKLHTLATNKLFLICPDSHLENFIRQYYGDRTYYLTALGAVFDFRRVNYAEAVANFIRHKPISEIYLTQDIAGKFLRNILDKKSGLGTVAEKKLLDLLIDNYSGIMRHTSREQQLSCLADIALREQANELRANYLLQQTISESGASLKGLLINRGRNYMQEIVLQPTELCK